MSLIACFLIAVALLIAFLAGVGVALTLIFGVLLRGFGK